jgi:hypothetical protein
MDKVELTHVANDAFFPLMSSVCARKKLIISKSASLRQHASWSAKQRFQRLRPDPPARNGSAKMVSARRASAEQPPARNGPARSGST